MPCPFWKAKCEMAVTAHHVVGPRTSRGQRRASWSPTASRYHIVHIAAVSTSRVCGAADTGAANRCLWQNSSQIQSPPPPLYKLRPCPSYSRRRDRINLGPNFNSVPNVVQT